MTLHKANLLLCMFVMQSTVNNFLKYYESSESRPVFETVDGMLKWAGLYNLTTRTLLEELIDSGFPPLLIEELVTVRTFTIILQCFLHYSLCALVDFSIFRLILGTFTCSHSEKLYCKMRTFRCRLNQFLNQKFYFWTDFGNFYMLTFRTIVL